MTRTLNDSSGPAELRGDLSLPSPAERVAVLAGFAAAALCTAWSIAAGAGIETVAAAWLAAGAWAFVSSLALALRRGFHRRDWRAFGRYEMTDNTELVDWSTKSGAWFDMALAEENERLMRGD
ncbi:MAG: hypothetical protein OXC15_16255 [Rhodospirillaceae bacterium]|nr:hypothetical protein [Rhodospirillaceae bacterium]